MLKYLASSYQCHLLSILRKNAQFIDLNPLHDLRLVLTVPRTSYAEGKLWFWAIVRKFDKCLKRFVCSYFSL